MIPWLTAQRITYSYVPLHFEHESCKDKTSKIQKLNDALSGAFQKKVASTGGEFSTNRKKLVSLYSLPQLQVRRSSVELAFPCIAQLHAHHCFAQLTARSKTGLNMATLNRVDSVSSGVFVQPLQTFGHFFGRLVSCQATKVLRNAHPLLRAVSLHFVCCRVFSFRFA